MADGGDDDDELLTTHGLDALAGQKTEAAELRLYPLHCVPPAGRCRRILYSTKGGWLDHLTRGFARFPDDVAVMWRHGPLDSCHREYVRAVVAHFGAPLAFVGDLDPLDLVTYASLVAGPQPISAEYVGISEAWLGRCRAALAHPLERVCISMSPAERAGVQRLLQMRPDFGGLIGTRAIELLESGLKLELEGATNPSLYPEAFVDEQIRVVAG